VAGVAEFSTLDRSLSLSVRGNKLGQVEVQGEAIDLPGTGNTLAFHFAIDQSYLPETLRQLDAIVNGAPAR
jgi:hypothetical protein